MCYMSILSGFDDGLFSNWDLAEIWEGDKGKKTKNKRFEEVAWKWFIVTQQSQQQQKKIFNWIFLIRVKKAKTFYLLKVALQDIKYKRTHVFLFFFPNKYIEVAQFWQNMKELNLAFAGQR